MSDPRRALALFGAGGALLLLVGAGLMLREQRRLDDLVQRNRALEGELVQMRRVAGDMEQLAAEHRQVSGQLNALTSGDNLGAVMLAIEELLPDDTGLLAILNEGPLLHVDLVGGSEGSAQALGQGLAARTELGLALQGVTATEGGYRVTLRLMSAD